MRAAEALGASPAPAQAIRFGYAAITWGGNDRQAIEDVAAVGFPGIQLRSNVVAEFADKPAALKELLQAHDLKMVALSSGGVSVTAPPEEEFVKHERHAAFVRAVGGMYLQVTDQLPKGRAATAADRRILGERMTEIGKRTDDLGILLGYHNHMNSLGERPGEVDEILAAADPRYVRLELDVAHYTQGGGDPVKAIDRYHERLLFLHLKDVEPVPAGAGADPSRSYRFVELGRGRVDLPGVFAALKRVGFKGWAVVELDAVPDKTRTPKDSAQISKTYLEKQGFRIEEGGSA
jgi:inosose dehydratase